jgi:hypothetical protein
MKEPPAVELSRHHISGGLPKQENCLAYCGISASSIDYYCAANYYLTSSCHPPSNFGTGLTQYLRPMAQPRTPDVNVPAEISH